MITDIPQAKDFRIQGRAFLNMAWDTALDLEVSLENARDDLATRFASSEKEVAESEDNDGDESSNEAYWRAARHSLATALTLAYQGTEMLIKAKITEVSPFLLLKGDWYSGTTAKSNTPFNKLHTIDAQDVIRVHNTVATPRLSDQFQTQFNELRTLRNTITHTVSKEIRVTVIQIVRAVLSAVDVLLGHKQWIKLRRSWLMRQPGIIAYSAEDYAEYKLIRECKSTLKLLERKELLTHFGFDKKDRKYICTNCGYQAKHFQEENFFFAQLLPSKAAKSTRVYCFVCKIKTKVAREKCTHCPGDVLQQSSGRCLTCGKDNL